MFAENYLKKNSSSALISTSVSLKTGIIVVIPCLNEPDILQTLASLQNCDLPDCDVEVLVVINHSEIALDSIKAANQKTKSEIESWILEKNNNQLCFFAIGPLELRKKWAGAGLARKQGMDEAVRRFSRINNAQGIVVSLDADTLVEKNYLVEIEKHFATNPKNVGATISFQHQIGNLPAKHHEGILLYENYLTYYKDALNFTGYPFSMFTVGSAFAVTAEAYVKRGGMNRRQAGEDFYFLQNLVHLGNVGEITSTKVYPSARLSDRVPFGTGPVLQKWIDGDEDLTLTYNFEAFKDLKDFFDLRTGLFRISENKYKVLVSNLPTAVSAFLLNDNFWVELEDLNKNCSVIQSFQNRFFQKFNAFKILKYMNFAHGSFYQKENIYEQINKLNQYK